MKKIPEKIRIFASLLILVGCGIAISIAKAPFSFGTEDHLLFHAFGHWIADGQVFTRDFIHFRTPGPYYYYGFIQKIIGNTFFATSFALLAEAHVAQVVASFFLAMAASRAFCGRSSVTLAFCTGLLFLAIPPIYQLRTAVPALCLAVYIFSLNIGNGTAVSQSKRLWATGVLLGMCYWFGQEVFLFLALAIVAAECSVFSRRTMTVLARRLVVLALAALAPIVVGVLYFYASGVDIKEYFYNTTYYAFVIQPKGMDTQFPPLGLSNAVFYIWLFVFIFSVFIFALRKTLLGPSAIALFSYTGLRLISMFGRADVLHLLFSISELFIILPISLFLLFEKRKVNSEKFAFPAAIVSLYFLVVITIGVRGSASVLLSIPFALLVFSRFEFFTGDQRSSNVCSILATKPAIRAFSLTGLACSLALTYPYSRETLKLDIDAFSYVPSYKVLGVQTTPERKQEFDEVRREISAQDAHVIFSYPIRAEYYAFTKLHATRFIEFAPQTTKFDITNAISDLSKTQPKLVFRDLEQVAALSSKLHDLSDYIMSNYTPVRTLDYSAHLEILVRRGRPVQTRRFYDNIDVSNADRALVGPGLRTSSDGKTLLIVAVNKGSGVFKFPSCQNCFISAKIYAEGNTATSGEITVLRDGKSVTQTVSVSDGLVEVPVMQGTGDIEIDLKSHDPQKAVFWEDPMLKEHLH